ncbi:MAG TPA: HD domain-containing protein [Longimicrobium sp.]|uniref:HD domain-containing protein n=1 Tax=Longimicrobium sp. TaxID=2029185 RepID=UPI002EDB2318
MVDVVYPGATHNRFLHSLGTLHMCAQLMTNCRNSEKMLRGMGHPDHPYPVRISPYAELLARLVALLHDAAHVPFGHVFEREAQVFGKDEWEDTWRREQVFGKKSPLVKAAREFFVRHFADFEEQSFDETEAVTAADALLNEILEVLTAKNAAVMRLRYPFVADLVGNTICADLLDYVQRDMYYSGLTEGLAKRFLNYLAVLPVRASLADLKAVEKLADLKLLADADPEYPTFALPARIQTDHLHTCRIVLLQYRYNSRHAASTKHNVLPEAIDLVRRRKLIAEKLYFHKTKLTATAMLGAAAHAADITSAKNIWDLSDHEVLKVMVAGGQSKKKPTGSKTSRRRLRAERLATYLLERRLFKPFYLVGFHPDIDDETGFRLWGPDGIYQRFGSPAGRELLIEKLEDILGLQLNGNPEEGVGKVAISCPEKRMQLKQFEMLVLARPELREVRMLQDSVRPTVREEIDAIQHGHQDQWRLEVFVDRSAFSDGDRGENARLLPVEAFIRLFAGAVQAEMGLPNELVDFRDAIPIRVEQLLRKMELERDLRHHNLRDTIREVHFKQLEEMQAAARGHTELVEQLREWGYEIRPDAIGREGTDEK